MSEQKSDTKSSLKSEQKDDQKADQKADSKTDPKADPKSDHKVEQKDDQKGDQKVEDYKNLEFEQMKARAPKILAEMVQMLITWQKMGYNVPRGVKNIFEFTWDELTVTLPRKSFSGLHCPVVKLITYDEATFPSAPAARIQKVTTLSLGKRTNYMTSSTENQQMLLRFQKRSIHLLTELLKLKMRIMIEAVAGPSAEDIAKRFLEYGLQLSPKCREEAADFMNKEPRRKGRGTVPTMPAIPITSTTQLIQQMSTSCLCFSLTFKDIKQKSSGLLKFKGTDQEALMSDKLDPCPEAREKLRELCRHMEQEKAAAIAKGHLRPLILKNYMTIHKSPSQALKRGSISQTAAEIRRSKTKKFFFALPDGTSIIYYPSGNVAVYQFPICCIGKTITLLFQDAPSQMLLGMFTASGHSCLRYSFKARNSIAVLMNQEGGSVRDKFGCLTHHWNWYSKTQVLQSLDFQINDQIKVKVISQVSMSLTFCANNESIAISLVRPGCPHGSKAEKQLTLKTIGDDEKEHWKRSLIEIKNRFEKRVKQYVNCVLMISGICCIEYPLEFHKPVRATMKKIPLLAWDRKPQEEAAISVIDGKHRPAKSFIGYQQVKRRYTPTPRSRAETPGGDGLEPWAISPTDCPIVLRRILTKSNDGLGCKCVVKMPLITDLEFEKFISSPRNPHQVLVIFVLALQNHPFSPFFEWSVEKLYVQMQYGRPSPCIQSKHDPFRFLKYDLDCPLNKTPPLLVQKHGVVPGMVMMYAGGKLLFGSCVLNGYSYSKRDLLKQIDQVCLDCRMGHFLPDGFKFSPVAEPSKKPSCPRIESLYMAKVKEPEEEKEPVVEEKAELEEKIKRAGRGKKKGKK